MLICLFFSVYKKASMNQGPHYQMFKKAAAYEPSRGKTNNVVSEQV